MMVDHADMINKILLIYVSIAVIVYVLIFVLSDFLYKRFIPYMQEKKMGQVIRKEGMETHYKKEGTPTMGGIVFGIIFIGFGALYTLIKMILNNIYFDIQYVPILCLFTFLLMCIGYKDDIKKITKNNSDGLSPKAKLVCQILSSLIFIIAIISLKNTVGYSMYIKIPFVNIWMKDIRVNMADIVVLSIVVLVNVFILVGTQNGVNFTDGLDALLANVTIVVAIFYILESIIKLNLCLTLMNIVMLSLLFNFRKYNKYPAKVFMGDTGSLMLGAYVGGMAFIMDIQYFLPIYGFVYMTEVISVILQVSYYKMTKGKRIFKMAPIHHHFEKCGWSEKKVVKIFTIVTIVTCMISLVLLNIR